jgi:hypothetical protein
MEEQVKRNVFLVLLIALLFSLAQAGDEGSWFDAEKCELCKPMRETKGLMEHAKWEHHNVSNGTVCITEVDEPFVDSYKKAMTEMDAIGKRWMSGEPVYVCNMCKSMGTILRSGAVSDKVESGNTFIGVTSSNDPEVVKMIHGWADRTNKEMKAMAAGGHSEHPY